MKKIYRLIGLIIVLSLLVIGCSTDDTGEEESKDLTPTQTEEAEKDTAEDEEPTKEKDKEKEEKKVEELYSSRLVNMMKEDRYTMKMNSVVDLEGEEMESLVTTVVADGQTATIIESGDVSMTSIIKEDKSYTVVHNEKIVIISPITEDDKSDLDEPGLDELDFNDINYVGKGREDFLGNERAYEEYKIDDSSIRYYFDGKELDGMKIISSEDTAIIDVEFFSDEVDMSVFEIPEDYEKVEY